MLVSSRQKLYRQNLSASLTLRSVSEHDWFWEGAVQDAVVTALTAEGWRVERAMDTASRERGIDILATKDNRTLAVEVKGYPTTTYQRGPKQGLPKPTAPTNQARQWFSHALLAAVLTPSSHPGVEVALAFPDMPRFRGLLDRSAWALRRLGTGVYLVREGGGVERLLDHSAGPNSQIS